MNKWLTPDVARQALVALLGAAAALALEPATAPVVLRALCAVLPPANAQAAVDGQSALKLSRHLLTLQQDQNSSPPNQW